VVKATVLAKIGDDASAANTKARNTNLKFLHMENLPIVGTLFPSRGVVLAVNFDLPPRSVARRVDALQSNDVIQRQVRRHIVMWLITSGKTTRRHRRATAAAVDV